MTSKWKDRFNVDLRECFFVSHLFSLTSYCSLFLFKLQTISYQKFCQYINNVLPSSHVSSKIKSIIFLKYIKYSFLCANWTLYNLCTREKFAKLSILPINETISYCKDFEICIFAYNGKPILYVVCL